MTFFLTSVQQVFYIFFIGLCYAYFTNHCLIDINCKDIFEMIYI